MQTPHPTTGTAGPGGASDASSSRSEGCQTLSAIKPSRPALFKARCLCLRRSPQPTIGTFISLILYGICALQLYRYVRLYPKDNVSIKCLVIIVMALETFHTVLPMHSCYYYLVTNYFNPNAAERGVWSINIVPTIAGFLVLCSQAFFARRVYLIGGMSRLVAAAAAVALLGHIGTSIYLTYEAFNLDVIDTFTDKTKYISFASLVCAAAADLMLSSAIIVALPRTRTNGQQNDSSKLETATLYILNTGLLTGLVHSVAAILSIAWPYRLYWAATGLVAIKMYAVTLFAVLNSRKLLVSRGIEIFDTDNALGMNILSRANHIAAAEQWNVPRVPEMPPVINIKVAAEIDTDGQSHRESRMAFDRKVASSLPL